MTTTKRITLHTFSFFLTFFSIPIFANGFGSLEFRHISTNLGLSQKTVQSIFQDQQGFMWIGTQEGLNRYDGREIRIFTNMPDAPSSLSNNVIRAITEDNNGNLWIATSNGLNRYDSLSQSFERIPLFTSNGEVVSKLYSFTKYGGWNTFGRD